MVQYKEYIVYLHHLQKKWDILKKHCTMLTLKPLAETRWECKINSVRAIRFQVLELINALEEISDTTTDSKIKRG